MTVHTLSTICILLAAATAQALDLTPLRGTRQGNEGAPTPVVQFTDGNGRIDYRPPSGWEPSGSSKTVTFFTADPTSWMKFEVVEKLPSQPPGATATPQDELQAVAARFVPQGAEKLEFVKMVPSPFTIGTHASSEYIFEYTSFGSRVSISISIIDLNARERLIMLVSANTDKFEPVRQQAMASMFSWSLEG